MTGFEACKMYMALKLHFDPASKYDFFHYEGRIKWLTPEKFDLRKDKWFFHKLAKLYSDNTTCLFFLASNFFEQERVTWVRDLLGEEAKSVYLEKLRVKESLMYLVNEDLDMTLADAGHELTLQDMKDALRVNDGEYPTLLTAAIQGTIDKEALVPLNAAMGFLPIWEKKITDTIIFPAFKHRCLAYQPFLNIDVKKFREALKQRLTKA